jgi:hypothetical protein
MAESPLPAFPHRRNHDGTFDSICFRCFATVAKEKNEVELKKSEEAHECSGPALAVVFHSKELSAQSYARRIGSNGTTFSFCRRCLTVIAVKHQKADLAAVECVHICDPVRIGLVQRIFDAASGTPTAPESPAVASYAP